MNLYTGCLRRTREKKNPDLWLIPKCLKSGIPAMVIALFKDRAVEKR